MTRIRNVSPLTLITLMTFAAFAVYVFTPDDSTAGEAEAAAPVKWEYALIRLEGVDHGKRDAAIAQLNAYGRNGWEAVELLPPAYDILMKRPAGGGSPPAGSDDSGGYE